MLTTTLADLISLDRHTISSDEALQRLSVSPQTGLDGSQVQRRQQDSGKNVITPPRRNYVRKLLEWVLGGFGSLLLVGSILCFVSWYVCLDPCSCRMRYDSFQQEAPRRTRPSDFQLGTGRRARYRALLPRRLPTAEKAMSMLE